MTDTTPAPVKALTKGDIRNIYWRSTTLLGSFNFERMQAMGFCVAMIPAIKRFYSNKEDQAAALGVSMVVALNSDASVKRLGKGDDRPVNTLEDRLAVMAALGCVALVTWFDEDTPLQRILDCQPEILVKGGDWPVEKIVGCTEVRGWGGTVHSIPFIHQKSTTALLEKIRKL